MTPQELKNSILLQAVNGEILEQNPFDAPAVSFVEPIRREQQRLLQEKLIKKEKFDPTISYTEVLPEGWCYVKLGELTTVITKQTGFDYSNHIKPNLLEFPKDGTIPMIQTKNFKGKDFNLKTDYYIPLSIAQQFPKILLDSKSMLLSIVGASIGNVGIYDDPAIAMIGGAICKVNLIDERLYEYLFYYLQSPLGQQEIKKNYKATAQGTITVQDVREIVIKMPPLEEQKRIVAKLEEILPLIDRYEAAWNKLEEFNKRFPGDMQKSILQLAIQGKLVEQRPEEGTGEELFRQIQAKKQSLIAAGNIKKEKPLPEIAEDEIPFSIPDTWKWVRIGQIFTLQAGKNITASDIFDKKSDSHKYLCYGGNGVRGYVASFNREGHYSLIGRQGALCGNINIAQGQFYATEHAVVVNHFDICDVLWSAYFLRALNLNQYATATAQPGLSVANIINVLIPLPPLEEQKRIVAKLEEILPLCDRLK